ncbi:MAG: IPT/TIG domain-containing protein [Myxococcales bacterium]|nr:IPT/TIG domain-containing protein [Myxococcales bacterium]MDH3485793.1 IPT/TIG domain-containing protein [Myxococcales bacterium]
MKNAKCLLGVIIGAVIVLGACQKQSTNMAFERLDPDFGGLQGGKSVRVLGDNIRLDIGYSVLFGQQISPQVSIESDKALVAVTPRTIEAGRVDVVIRTDDGSVFRIKEGFQYVNQAGNLLNQPDEP